MGFTVIAVAALISAGGSGHAQPSWCPGTLSPYFPAAISGEQWNLGPVEPVCWLTSPLAGAPAPGREELA